MDTISNILQYLFNTYGKITADSLLEIENELREKEFDIIQPMVSIYNEIKILQSMYTAANNPFSDMQLVKSWNQHSKKSK